MRFSTLSVSQFSYCCSGLRRLKLAGKWERVAGGERSMMMMVVVGRRWLLFLLCLHSATEVDIFVLCAFQGGIFIIIPFSACAPLVYRLFRHFSSVCQSWFSLVLMPLIMFRALSVWLSVSGISVYLFFPMPAGRKLASQATPCTQIAANKGKLSAKESCVRLNISFAIPVLRYPEECVWMRKVFTSMIAVHFFGEKKNVYITLLKNKKTKKSKGKDFCKSKYIRKIYFQIWHSREPNKSVRTFQK